VLVGGLIATCIGVADDYWADGMGFPIEVLGLLAMIAGTTLYGVATLRAGVLPPWSSWLLVAGGPGALVGMALFGHIASGPTLLFAASWLAVGVLLSTHRARSGSLGADRRIMWKRFGSGRPQQSAAALCDLRPGKRGERQAAGDRSNCSRLTSRRSPVRAGHRPLRGSAPRIPPCPASRPPSRWRPGSDPLCNGAQSPKSQKAARPRGSRRRS
jgi:hypothetical protein